MANQKKGVVMGVLQMAMAIVGLLVGLSTLGRESAPLISKMMEQRGVVQSNNIEYIYRSEDGMYRYYSDSTNYYWMRVSIHGVVEYAQNPQLVR